MIRYFYTAFICFIFFVSLRGQTSEWEVVDTMPLPVAGGEAVVYNGKIFLMGGYADSVQMGVDWIHSYEPGSKTWIFESSMAVPRSDFVAGVNFNGLYYTGGSEIPGIPENEIEHWDFNRTLSPAPIFSHTHLNRYFASGLIIDSSLFLIGGLSVSGVPFISEFNLNDYSLKKTFEDPINFGTLTFGLMSAYLNDSIYIFGGITFGISPKIFKLDRGLNEITHLIPSLNTPRAMGKAVAFPTKNEIYIIGGQNESEAALGSVEILQFDSTSNYAVTEAPSLNVPRTNFMAVLFEDNIYVFGGYDKFGNIVEEVEKISLDQNITEVSDDLILNSFELSQNYPNPFNPSTTISFTIPENSNISLDIYSITGQHVANLINDYYNRGEYSVKWDGSDSGGRKVSAGVYIYRLMTPEFTESKSMMLLK